MKFNLRIASFDSTTSNPPSLDGRGDRVPCLFCERALIALRRVGRGGGAVMSSRTRSWSRGRISRAAHGRARLPVLSALAVWLALLTGTTVVNNHRAVGVEVAAAVSDQRNHRNQLLTCITNRASCVEPAAGLRTDPTQLPQLRSWPHPADRAGGV